ncbi:hypothetical protein [Zestomonas carbonaria]|uniref:Uncharacterized protein n=1 Tax=Zestomonas carbonaria TaxID=2762745 RepID=A0A7U7EK00_9GAMM|nr:hypothetical protein [Pseudomonas carbonaria]CAD5106033.1 hypothetical protein PSEWESI4_00292 [Pseudomonas carbonaria]
MPSALSRFRWLIYTAVLAICAWSLWTQWQQRPAEPMGWLVDWQGELFVPLAGGVLSVQGLRERAPGSLWLAPKGEEGPRLLYRADWQDGDVRWKVEAELALSDKERASLLGALGATAEDGEQVLSDTLLEQLGQHRLSDLLLKPESEVREDRLSASLGAPRARFGLPDGGEAWLYPQSGLTLYLTDGRLDLMQVASNGKQDERPEP